MPTHTNTLPCKTVVEQMNADGRHAFEVMPAFVPGGAETFDDWLKQIVEASNRETDAYIYAYWTEPDTALHHFGENSDHIKILLHDMEQKIEKALGQIVNKTDVLITADHGHKLSKPLFLSDFPDIEQSLVRPISIEARAASLFVKPEKIAEFPAMFNKHFSKWFKLVTKQEFEQDYLHASSPVRFVGDFMALAIAGHGLYQNRDAKYCNLVSNHAGITKEELEIPIIQYFVNKNC